MMTVEITHVVPIGRSGEARALMEVLAELMRHVLRYGGTYVVREDADGDERVQFVELLTFETEDAFDKFDETFTRDRKVAAIYALLEEIVDPVRSGYRLLEASSTPIASTPSV